MVINKLTENYNFTNFVLENFEVPKVIVFSSDDIDTCKEFVEILNDCQEELENLSTSVLIV